MNRIDSVVQYNWNRLVAGQKIDVPADLIEHPSERPDLFAPPDGAWPVGQNCDYVWPLSSGGRIHAQCFNTGGRPSIRIHRDRWDPSNGPVDFLLHALFETPVGPVLAGGLLLNAVLK